MLDVNAGHATSKLLRQRFVLTFQHASSGFCTGVEFTRENGVHPQRVTTSCLAILYRIAANYLEPTTQEDHSSGVSILTHTSLASGITKSE